MEVVLNEFTQTVHRHETGVPGLHTECGVTHTVSPDKLQVVPLQKAATEYDISKCGRCFDDGRGY